jgi:signal transduction histidine kinase
MNLAAHAYDDRMAARAGSPSRATRTARTLLYLLSAIPLGAAGLAVLIAGWVVVPVLAITPLVVPALVAYRAAVGGLARVEGALANALLGTATAPPGRSPGPRGFWRQAANVLGDAAFWRQQVFLLLRFAVGGTLAIAEVSLIAGGLGYVTLPIWYGWADLNYGSWDIDTRGRAFLLVPAGVAAVVLGLVLVRPLAALSRSLAIGLLGGDGPGYLDPASPVARARRRRALEVHAAAFAALGLVAVATWAGTTAGRYFWPAWVLVPLAASLAIHAWVVLVDARSLRLRVSRGFALHAGVSLVVFLELVAIWALSGAGYFWPLWVLLALVIVLASHAVIALGFRDQARRIAQLESTRAGAVDQQGSDLRRIERDLHDGAQAQLVALGMSIGMAEQKLASDPEAAQVHLAEARRGAQEALEDLRSLARGIHPPVLTDRGLGAAIAALAERTPLAVSVDVSLDERPPDAVETAAYFVVAEALANAGKHAGATAVDIAVRFEDGRLVVEVADDGVGGADPDGDGLRGLARRVEALDGALVVTSPAGGPTIVRAELPCAS